MCNSMPLSKDGTQAIIYNQDYDTAPHNLVPLATNVAAVRSQLLSFVRRVSLVNLKI